MNGRRARVVSLPFLSFLKLNVLSGLGLGLVLGLLHPIGEVFGVRVVGGVEAAWLTGPVAWIVYLFVFPLMFLFLSTLFSLVSFLPARLLLRWFGRFESCLGHHFHSGFGALATRKSDRGLPSPPTPSTAARHLALRFRS